jgi:hypothetical protein
MGLITYGTNVPFPIPPMVQYLHRNVSTTLHLIRNHVFVIVWIESWIVLRLSTWTLLFP